MHRIPHCLIHKGIDLEFTFSVGEILHEVQQHCYTAGEVIKGTSENQIDVHTTQDVLDDINAEIISTSVERYMLHCMNTFLYPYAKGEVVKKHDDNKYKEVDVYLLKLHFKNSIAAMQANYLKRLINDYVVYRCVTDWLATTAPQAHNAQVYLDKVEEIKNEICGCLSRQNRGRVRLGNNWY